MATIDSASNDSTAEQKAVIDQAVEAGVLASHVRKLTHLMQASSALGFTANSGISPTSSIDQYKYLDSVPPEEFSDRSWREMLADQFPDFSSVEPTELEENELAVFDKAIQENNGLMEFDADPVIELTQQNFSALRRAAFAFVREDDTQPTCRGEVVDDDWPAINCLSSIIRVAVNDACEQMRLHNGNNSTDDMAEGRVIIMKQYKRALLSALGSGDLEFIIPEFKRQVAAVFAVTANNNAFSLFELVEQVTLQDAFRSNTNGKGQKQRRRKRDPALDKLFGSSARKRRQRESPSQRRRDFLDDVGRN